MINFFLSEVRSTNNPLDENNLVRQNLPEHEEDVEDGVYGIGQHRAQRFRRRQVVTQPYIESILGTKTIFQIKCIKKKTWFEIHMSTLNMKEFRII